MCVFPLVFVPNSLSHFVKNLLHIFYVINGLYIVTVLQGFTKGFSYTCIFLFSVVLAYGSSLNKEILTMCNYLLLRNVHFWYIFVMSLIKIPPLVIYETGWMGRTDEWMDGQCETISLYLQLPGQSVNLFLFGQVFKTRL